MKKSVSVVIPTYNREEILCETIEQFKKQDYAKFTVHIVDHTVTHDENTLNYLQSLPDNFYHHKLSEGGLCTARNFGLKKSDGDIIIYVDDDVTVQSDFVSCHVREYDNSKIGAVAGQVLNPQHPNPIDKPPVGRITWYGRSISRLHVSQSGFVSEGRGCNMSFRKGLLDNIGGFDTSFEFRDESDVFCQVSDIQYLIYFSPKASVYHKESDAGGTIFTDQQSPSEIVNISRNKHYFHLKNKTLITFPIAILTSILFRIKIRNTNVHKIPYDTVLVLTGVYYALLNWIK